MSNFNCWWIVAPLLLAGAFVSGWLSTGMKACKPRARHWAEFLQFACIIVSPCVFGYLLFRESYLGFLQIALSCLTPADSEFYAHLIAICGILFACAVFFCLLILVGASGYDLKQKYLDATDGRRRRIYCRSVSREEAAAACPYGCSEKCPCGIDRRTRLNLTTRDYKALMDSLSAFFARQTDAGLSATCVVSLPVVDGQISLTKDELYNLCLQARDLGYNSPIRDQAQIGIQRSFADRVRDRARTAYRRVRANVHSVFGRRAA